MKTIIKIDERTVADPLIAPTVKALAALGIGVYAASEGSLNNGIAAPWVDIENLASDPHFGYKNYIATRANSATKKQRH